VPTLPSLKPRETALHDGTGTGLLEGLSEQRFCSSSCQLIHKATDLTEAASVSVPEENTVCLGESCEQGEEWN